MLEAQSKKDWTILDYLNDDCWFAVLQYVPVRDIIQTESTSKRWRDKVWKYLEGRIRIIGNHCYRDLTNMHTLILGLTEGKNALDFHWSFVEWLNEHGQDVAATCCNNMDILIRYREKCPNLRSLTFYRMKNRCHQCGLLELFPYNANMDFQCLQRLCFYDCEISDGCISHFIADKALEELELRDCVRVKGNFLNTINLSALKSLFLSSCDVLDSMHLLSAVERLGELKKLTLLSMCDDIFIEIQAVLHKMPKLEYLEIYDEYEMVCHDYKPLSRLVRLKELDVKYKLSDEAVKAVLQGCTQLRTLVFRDCTGMSARHVVQALCRWGTRLRSLSLMLLMDLDNDGLVAIISGCPELTRLQVTEAKLTSAVLERAASARRAVRPAGAGGRRLWLDLSNTILSNVKRLRDYEPTKLEYEDLIIKVTYVEMC